MTTGLDCAHLRRSPTASLLCNPPRLKRCVLYMCMFVCVCVCVCVCVLVCVLVCDDDDDDGVGVRSAVLMFKSITKLRANKTSVGGEEKGGWQSQAKPVCACVNAGKLLSCLLEYVVEENQESSWALRDVATDLTRCSCSHVCEST